MKKRTQTTKKQESQSHSGTGQLWADHESRSVIATVVHLIFFLCSMRAISIYDDYMLRNYHYAKCSGINTFGGRGKYLMYPMVSSCDNHMFWTYIM